MAKARYNITADEKTMDIVRVMAAVRNVSMGDILSEALQQYLDEHADEAEKARKLLADVQGSK